MPQWFVDEYGSQAASVLWALGMVLVVAVPVLLWEFAFAVRRWVIAYRSDFARFHRRAARWERRSRRDLRRTIRRTGGGW